MNNVRTEGLVLIGKLIQRAQRAPIHTKSAKSAIEAQIMCKDSHPKRWGRTDRKPTSKSQKQKPKKTFTNNTTIKGKMLTGEKKRCRKCVESYPSGEARSRHHLALKLSNFFCFPGICFTRNH